MNTEEMVRYKDQFWSKLNEKEQETYLLFGLSALSRKRRTESLEILRSLNREKKAKIKETENDHEMNESDQMEMDGMKQIDEMKQIDKIDKMDEIDEIDKSDKMEMDEMEEIEIKDSKKHNNNNNNNNNNKNNNYKPCKPRFRAHFECMDEALKLNVNDTVDYRFENGRVILCKILDKTMDDINKHYIILLHPLGESLTVTKHNRYCDLFTEYHLLAPPKSISLRKLTNKKHIFYDIQIDDYLDINPIYKSGHNGWKLGRVIKTDPNSGQIKAVYYNRNDQSNYSYWIHLENINEAAPFKTKCIDKTDNNENKTDVLQSPTSSISNIDCWHNVNIDENGDNPFNNICNDIFNHILEYTNCSLSASSTLSLVSSSFYSNIPSLKIGTARDVIKIITLYQCTFDIKYIERLRYVEDIKLSLCGYEEILDSLSKLLSICKNIKSLQIIAPLQSDGEIRYIISMMDKTHNIETLSLYATKTRSYKTRIPGIAREIERCQKLTKLEVICADLRPENHHNTLFITYPLLLRLNKLSIQYTHGLVKYVNDNLMKKKNDEKHKRYLNLIFGPKNRKFNGHNYQSSTVKTVANAINAAMNQSNKTRGRGDVITVLVDLFNKFDQITIQKENKLEGLINPNS